ncbi:MAG: Mpo1-like protein [Gammaproteobacteria bacterium]
MRNVNALLIEYGESHQNRINKKIHWVCVPAIMFSLLGILWSLPFPVIISPFINWATVLIILSLIYYFFLSWKLAIGVLFSSLFMILILQWMDCFSVPLWQIAIAIFIVAWIGQFIGHHIEGKRPSFFKDIQFLLIGPVWLLADVYRKVHLEY